MAKNLNEGQVKQDFIRQMGQELGSLFFALWVELTWLNLKWKEYSELYGHVDPRKGKSRIDLLNKSAATFFRVVQVSLWENVLLHIACITDVPKTCGKNNLSIKRLEGLVQEEIKEVIIKHIRDVDEKATFCRDWRNRHIAHRDFDLVLGGEKAVPLEKANRKKVKDALESIARVLNAVSIYYTKEEIIFDKYPVSNGAESLFYILDDGIKVDMERMKRVVAGEMLPKDIECRDQ